MLESVLAGVRVLDLSFWLPGPFCSRILADLGAEVIKVERRLMGDPIRLAGPFLGDQSCHFLTLNRNKKSLAVNLRRPEGREILLKLVATADVFLEGFKPGQTDKMGIGYPVLHEINPGLVYCSLSGFGQEGAYVNRAGHDITYSALAGLLEPPALPSLQYADLSGGLYAAIGILAALVRRGVGGQGAYVDVAILDSLVGLMSASSAALLCGQVADETTQYLTGYLPGYNLYQSKDGRWMALGALEPVFWSEFCQVVGREDWIGQQFPAADERELMMAEMRTLFAGRTQAEWVQFFACKDVCCEPVLSLEEALARPELKERGMLFYLDHPQAGRTPQIAQPVKFGATPAPAPAAAAPALGQDTEALLQELAYSSEEIAHLRRRRIVATPADRSGRRRA